MGLASDGEDPGDAKKKRKYVDISDTPSQKTDKYKIYTKPNYKRLFIENSNSEYIVYVESTNNEKIGNKNPILLTNIFTENVKGIIGVHRINAHKIGVTFRKATPANYFLKMEDFFIKYNLRAFIPSYLTEKIGILKFVPKDLSNEEIYKNIICDAEVISIKRFMKKVDGVLTPLYTVAVTFSSTNLPQYEYIKLFRYEIHKYIPPLLQCYKCLKFNHSARVCRGIQNCSSCAGSHSYKECDVDEVVCINCNGNHLAISRDCPVRKQKIEDNKKRYVQQSYATVVMHILCTICSDIINQAENLNVTKCGHIFHYHCLSQWLERAKSCPQCRGRLTQQCMFRVYPTISNESSNEDVTVLQSRLDDAQLQLRQQRITVKQKEDQLDAAKEDLRKNDELVKSLQQQQSIRESAIAALKNQLSYVKTENKEFHKIKDENELLKKNLQILNGLQKVLNATSREVEEMLEGYTDVRTVATFATALKRALCESESKKKEIRDKLQSVKQDLVTEKVHGTELEAKLVQLKQQLSISEGLRKRKASDVSLNRNDRRRVKLSPSTSAEVADSHNNIIVADEIDSSYNTIADNIDSFVNNIDSFVNNIETADSPYLSLKQSSLALAALQQRPAHLPPVNKLKPSELALINAAKKATQKPSVKNVPNAPHSIFNKKEPQKLDVTLQVEPSRTDPFNISYDGFGGHSKLDTFPVPNSKPPVKTCVPKLTSKHRLKKPNPPAGNQDISKLLGRINKIS